MEIKRLEGQRYGRLVILSRDGAVNYISRYTCRCDCGNVVHGMRLESIKKSSHVVVSQGRSWNVRWLKQG